MENKVLPIFYSLLGVNLTKYTTRGHTGPPRPPLLRPARHPGSLQRHQHHSALAVFLQPPPLPHSLGGLWVGGSSVRKGSGFMAGRREGPLLPVSQTGRWGPPATTEGHTAPLRGKEDEAENRHKQKWRTERRMRPNREGQRRQV